MDFNYATKPIPGIGNILQVANKMITAEKHGDELFIERKLQLYYGRDYIII